MSPTLPRNGGTRNGRTARGHNDAGFFMWDESTDGAVVQAAIAAGIRSFRSRDLGILVQTPPWEVFVANSDAGVDVLAAIPLFAPWSTDPVDLDALIDTVNAHAFVRRLQVYPALQPGLMNPTELDPCRDWGDGAEVGLAEAIQTLKNSKIGRNRRLSSSAVTRRK